MVRFLLVFFPVGLIIGGVVAVWLYAREEDRKKEASAPHISAVPLHAEGLARHVKQLCNPAGVPAVYIESTLGPGNLGAQVAASRWKAGGLDGSNLTVEVRGSDSEGRTEAVIVAAAFDTMAIDSPEARTSAAAAAALLSLTEASADKPLFRTVRYSAVERIPAAESAGFARLAADSKSPSRKVSTVLLIELPEPPPGQQAQPGQPSLIFTADAAAAALAERAAASWQKAVPGRIAAAKSDTVSSPAAAPLTEAGLPVIRVSAGPGAEPGRLLETVQGLTEVIRTLAGPSAISGP